MIGLKKIKFTKWLWFSSASDDILSALEGIPGVGSLRSLNKSIEKSNYPTESNSKGPPRLDSSHSLRSEQTPSNFNQTIKLSEKVNMMSVLWLLLMCQCHVCIFYLYKFLWSTKNCTKYCVGPLKTTTQRFTYNFHDWNFPGLVWTQKMQIPNRTQYLGAHTFSLKRQEKFRFQHKIKGIFLGLEFWNEFI